MCREAGMTDGTFGLRKYVRQGAPLGSWALCVVYKGKCTHHGIEPNHDGVLVVNKKMVFGNFTTVEELVDSIVSRDVMAVPDPSYKNKDRREVIETVFVGGTPLSSTSHCLILARNGIETDVGTLLRVRQGTSGVYQNHHRKEPKKKEQK